MRLSDGVPEPSQRGFTAAAPRRGSFDEGDQGVVFAPKERLRLDAIALGAWVDGRR